MKKYVYIKKRKLLRRSLTLLLTYMSDVAVPCYCSFKTNYTEFFFTDLESDDFNKYK